MFQFYLYKEEATVGGRHQLPKLSNNIPMTKLTFNRRSPRQIRRNERERGRKARLNAAFKVLRNTIPFFCNEQNKEKLTQVQILRLASRYIRNLTSMLSEAVHKEEMLSCQLQRVYESHYEVSAFTSL